MEKHMKVVKLPEAGREAMLEANGLSASAHWEEYDRSSLRVESPLDGEPTGPPRAGRARLRISNPAEREFVMEGGWSITDTHEGRASGMSAHRGVLHPDEYVDSESLRALVENELGFTYAEVHGVYRRGPVAGDDLTLRSRIDARVLQIEREGGNMVALGRALGFAVTERGNCTTIDNALARARAQEDGSWA